MKSTKTSTSKKGFTLVELIVVIAIMAILAAVLVPTVTNKVQESRIAGCKTELTNVCSAITNIMAEGHASENLEPELMSQYGYNVVDNYIACSTSSSYKIKYEKTETDITLTLCDNSGNALVGDEAFSRTLPIKSSN